MCIGPAGLGSSKERERKEQTGKAIDGDRKGKARKANARRERAIGQ